MIIKKVVEKGRLRVCQVFEKPSLTKQAMKKECDINNIMKKYKATGILPDLIKREPRYGDFSNAVDYQEACNRVITARTQFEALPAALRKRFGHDPAEFLAFVNDPENTAELKKMGLLKDTPGEGQGAGVQGQQAPVEGKPEEKGTTK